MLSLLSMKTSYTIHTPSTVAPCSLHSMAAAPHNRDSNSCKNNRYIEQTKDTHAEEILVDLYLEVVKADSQTSKFNSLPNFLAVMVLKLC